MRRNGAARNWSNNTNAVQQEEWNEHFVVFKKKRDYKENMEFL